MNLDQASGLAASLPVSSAPWVVSVPRRNAFDAALASGNVCAVAGSANGHGVGDGDVRQVLDDVLAAGTSTGDLPLRSRVATASSSCSRSVTWFTAVRLKRLWPGLRVDARIYRDIAEPR